jgi:hypothetical protein
MKLSIPLTGTLVSYNPIEGDPDDPVRPIPLKLGNVSMQLVALDLPHDLALIEVTPAPSEPNPQALLDRAKALLLDNTQDELYKKTNTKRLRKPTL